MLSLKTLGPLGSRKGKPGENFTPWCFGPIGCLAHATCLKAYKRLSACGCLHASLACPVDKYLQNMILSCRNVQHAVLLLHILSFHVLLYVSALKELVLKKKKKKHLLKGTPFPCCPDYQIRASMRNAAGLPMRQRTTEHASESVLLQGDMHKAMAKRAAGWSRVPLY